MKNDGFALYGSRYCRAQLGKGFGRRNLRQAYSANKQLYLAPNKSNLVNFKAFNRYQSWDYCYFLTSSDGNENFMNHNFLYSERWRGERRRRKKLWLPAIRPRTLNAQSFLLHFCHQLQIMLYLWSFINSFLLVHPGVCRCDGSGEIMTFYDSLQQIICNWNMLNILRD